MKPDLKPQRSRSGKQWRLMFSNAVSVQPQGQRNLARAKQDLTRKEKKNTGLFLQHRQQQAKSILGILKSLWNKTRNAD